MMHSVFHCKHYRFPLKVLVSECVCAHASPFILSCFHDMSFLVCIYVCVCVRAHVHACVSVCVCVCVLGRGGGWGE